MLTRRRMIIAKERGDTLSNSKLCNILLLSLFITLMTTGCVNLFGVGNSFNSPQKSEVGPTGKPVESKPNPPILERFLSPPIQLYDLEATAGVLFEGINNEKWDQAHQGLTNLQTIWEQSKPLLGEKKGVKEANVAMEKLTKSVVAKEVTASYENLTSFMSAISDIGKSFKLSPIADIIAVGNSARNVAFYVEDKNWSKSAVKVKEMEGVWQQVKPSMEQVGILSELTKTHTSVKQLKDAVNAENKGAVEEHLANLNESMGLIRIFYYGR